MKLTGLLEVISTYETYVSEFLSWWPTGQFHDLLITSLWGNMKMLPVKIWILIWNLSSRRILSLFFFGIRQLKCSQRCVLFECCWFEEVWKLIIFFCKIHFYVFYLMSRKRSGLFVYIITQYSLPDQHRWIGMGIRATSRYTGRRKRKGNDHWN